MAADAARGGGGLAAALEAAGPAAAASEAALQEVLRGQPAPTETAVAEVLGVVARTSGAGGAAWPVDTLVAGLKAANPALDWARVAEHLDAPGFAVPDAAALRALMAAWRAATPDPFPLRAAAGGLWRNAAGQLSLLAAAAAAPPGVFPWDAAERRLEPLEGLAGGRAPGGTPNGAWLCLDLYEALASLADSGLAPGVRAALEAPRAACPELLLLGAAAVEGGWGPLQAEVVDALAQAYAAPHANSAAVLPRLWAANRGVLLRALVAMYGRDPASVSRALDVCQDLKALPAALDATPAPFCIELAALAARREFLDLDRWLGEQFAARGLAFMQAAIAFLDLKLRDDSFSPGGGGGAPPGGAPGAAGAGRVAISVDALAAFLRALAGAAGMLPTDVVQQLKMVQAAAVQAHPQLAAVVAGAGGMEAFPPDVEEEANAFFQRVYSGDLSVDALVEALAGFKNSTLAREQEVFACMVHNLFDEFRFFPKYPDAELATTALLFGRLVRRGLVSAVSLNIALRYVLEALRSGAGSKMFRFATAAAAQFADDLPQWPAFAAQVAAVPGLRDAAPELHAAAEAAAAAGETAAAAAPAAPPAPGAAAAAAAAGAAAAAAAAAAAFAPPGGDKGAASALLNAAGFPTSASRSAAANPNALFSTINAETLEHAAQNVSYAVPSERAIDRVHFVVNNISAANVDAKVKELQSLVPPEHHPWFVNYMVVKRAAQEPNYHGLYAQVVERWGDRGLARAFVRATVHYATVMLGSELLRTNSSERTLLKNLGAWLGKLTLAKNRPVLQRDLDVKAVVVAAYEQGKMLAVLSFVRLFLESAADSLVFRPPNPWVMAILALMAEVYALEGLKTGLKFEVELLFKSLGLQLQDVEPSRLLAGRPRLAEDNPDFQAARPAAAAAGGAPGGAPGAGGAAPVAAAAAAGPIIDPAVIANLHNFIAISPQLAIVAERLRLKQLVPMAVDRAIVEIISPVVDRSVTIACMTAQELVAKDFAAEPDEARVKAAAHAMVTGLAQSLALVTAKEPLRLAVASNLRALLANQLEPSTLEQVVGLLVGDNLDLCCQVVERAAAERAAREVDERLAGAYAARARARAAGQPYADAAHLAGRFPGALPDALRARPGQLTPQQAAVYDDFSRIPRTAAAAAASAGAPRPGGADGGDAGAGGAAPGGAAPDLRARFLGWLQRMDAAVGRDPGAAPAHALPESAEVRRLAAELGALPGGSEAVALEVAKNVFAKAYQAAGSRAAVSAYGAALAALRDAALRRLPVELTAWFAQLPDDAKFNKDVGEAFVRYGLFHLPDLDAYLAKALAGPRYQPAAEFVLGLAQSCAVAEPLLGAGDLAASFDALARLAARASGGHAVVALVDEARRAAAARAGAGGAAAGAAPPPPPAPEPPKDPPALIESVMKAFDRWARLLEEAPAERAHAGFVGELRAAGLLGAADGATERFVRVMATLAVQHCLRSEGGGAPPGGAPRPAPAPLSFVAVDAFVRLMVCLVTQHGGGPALLAQVLGTVAAQLQRDADERGAAFNGRPYYRIIVGFLGELSPADPADEGGLPHLTAIAGFLYATRASRAPGFAFPWLQLAADRRLMPRLLLPPSRRGWGPYLQLLLAQLRFLEPFLRAAELTDAARLLYKGTLRLLLVLLHDFPEFLCRYHFALCDVIPPSCIQMRNLVLSAFPRSMRLPDPFTPALKVDLLPEVSAPPALAPDPDALLPPPLRAEADAALGGPRGRAAAAAPGLRARLLLPPREAAAAGTRYNVPALNALVFYAGARAVEAAPGAPPAADAPALELFAALLRELDGEGRYLLLNAVANHLRFPNAHTHWFSCAALALFERAGGEPGGEAVQEQLTRVLLERLIVNRPHPWGLLITFIELIKNAKYAFWGHAFTRAAPEIERLFASVARSCNLAAPGEPGAPPAVAT